MQNYLMIGEVLKPQGVRGEVKIKPYAADPTLFENWKQLYLEDHGSYAPLPCSFKRLHEGYVYAVLGSCTTMAEAERLRGQKLWIDRAHAAPMEEDAVYIADLMGCEAIDENGVILGVLEDVLQYGSVDTWVFRTPRGSMMVPALKQVFPEVNPEAKKISVIRQKLQEVALLED